MHFSSIYSVLFSLISPYRCLCCGKKLFLEEIPLCDTCRNSLTPASESGCLKCGAPLISETDFCLRCRERGFKFKNSFSLFPYEGVVKELLWAYKFESIKSISTLFAELLAGYINSNYKDITILPVPCRRESRKLRGWDPVEEIAKILYRKYNIPYLTLLKRVHGKAQKSLSFQERQSNLKGKIFIQRGKYTLPKRILLLDDVFTTGATLNECAEVLISCGAEEIFCLTLARD